ncbi:PAS domain-containing protein [Mucilaginibacter oryzae]|uniref:histidine kinase n=1 Tax=Mucilaginibacter oryzae TaxID=468058 RepID=A0A316H9V8_9SPHI|nr:ATP-binding protein [Mucilaginibacter oryzae]PWK77844.1 PAS domain-containing protein [Mucilaginibacter oryzae]
MSFTEKGTSPGNNVSPARLTDDPDACIWEYNSITKEVKWSAGFYNILGYHPNEIESSAQVFFEHLLYYQDKHVFLDALYQSRLNQQVAPVPIRLLTKNNGYQWFESRIKNPENSYNGTIHGLLVNINIYKQESITFADKQFMHDEAFRIARLGSWEINPLKPGVIALSNQVYDIYDIQSRLEISAEEFISFFEPSYRVVLQQAIDHAIKLCRPFDTEALLRTAKNNLLWLKVKGIPVIDNYGHCITLKGIIQDIDNEKRKQLKLEQSVNLLTDQNRRLQNFAYIVSHNLRSHTGNLQFMVNLFEQTDEEEERIEIFSYLKTISDSLNLTIEHLNEIVKIQTEITNERSVVELEKLFKSVRSALKNNIESINAIVEYDFSQCTEINYIPAYMESIFQNLLTNSLKYYSPGRQPIIQCYTLREGNHIYLIFEDNGLGIDLNRHGDKVFGMYKTFHQNTDAKGIGLFITRNQIEALGGSITVESTVNVGTKFTIRLV